MSDTTEYRITFAIERAKNGFDFEEIGFGSSGAWDDLDAALYDVSSAIQNRQWETVKGQPDPATVDVEKEDA